MGAKVVLISLLVCQLCVIKVDGEPTYKYVVDDCIETGFNYTNGSAFQTNLNLLYEKLISKTSYNKFYDDHSVGDGSDKVYGLFQCRTDVSFEVCNACVQNATLTIAQECPFYSEAIIWYKECMLRYANREISSLSETWPSYFVKSKKNVTYDFFESILDDEMNRVIKNTSTNTQRFASAERSLSSDKQLFSFAQCTPDITKAGCTDCLNNSLRIMIEQSPSSAAVVVYSPSCQLWYNTSGPILNDLELSPPAPLPGDHQQSPTPPTTQPTSPSSKPSSSTKTAIIAACAIVGLLVLLIVLCICVRHKRRKEASNNTNSASQTRLQHDSDVTSLEEDIVHYDFATLRNITGDFAAENKLGEGGFGCVYKGTITDGECLAIKRLSDTSGQGTKEFMAEARFLAKLQHKNLVRLVGFCSEGEEKLLVYEFMSNSSLDGFLFDREKHRLLNWVTRNQTIVGIAQGLQYLHSDSRFTIIHRDLKPENILMDDEMNPKIADFGLARLFERTQKYGNTIRIAGTRGYMAPECLSGEYSSKSDVYSFGVMVLEIVFGHRMFKHNSPDDLLINAWRLWDEGRGIELVDPELDESFSNEDIKRCIQIGFLCVQARAEQRPTMKDVVLMLIVGEMVLPLPSPPMMSFPQFYMPRFKTGEQPSESDIYSTKSTTDDLHPKSNAR